MSNTKTLQSVGFSGWHEHAGATASAPVPVVGFDLAVVTTYAAMSPGDRLDFIVEGRKRGGGWLPASPETPFENAMRVGVPTVLGPHVTVNLKQDAFEELRLVWWGVRGRIGQLEATVSLRKAR
jgi:hypothetical protein